jgi:hypothetical protein
VKDQWKKSKYTILGLQSECLKLENPDYIGGVETEHRIRNHNGEIWEFTVGPAPRSYAGYTRSRDVLKALIKAVPSVERRYRKLDVETIPYGAYEEFLFRFDESEAPTVLQLMEFVAPNPIKQQTDTSKTIQKAGVR